eukprot:3247567-Rhodomonas_salina.1
MVCRQYLPISSPDCSSVFKHFILKLEKNKIMMFVSDDFDDGCRAMDAAPEPTQTRGHPAMKVPSFQL